MALLDLLLLVTTNWGLHGVSARLLTPRVPWKLVCKPCRADFSRAWSNSGGICPIVQLIKFHIGTYFSVETIRFYNCTSQKDSYTSLLLVSSDCRYLPCSSTRLESLFQIVSNRAGISMDYLGCELPKDEDSKVKKLPKSLEPTGTIHKMELDPVGLLKDECNQAEQYPDYSGLPAALRNDLSRTFLRERRRKLVREEGRLFKEDDNEIMFWEKRPKDGCKDTVASGATPGCRVGKLTSDLSLLQRIRNTGRSKSGEASELRSTRP